MIWGGTSCLSGALPAWSGKQFNLGVDAPAVVVGGVEVQHSGSFVAPGSGETVAGNRQGQRAGC